MCVEELGDGNDGKEVGGGDAEGRGVVRSMAECVESVTQENLLSFSPRDGFTDSCKDIARHRGRTEKNVSVRLTRIRQKLKEYLIEREVLI